MFNYDNFLDVAYDAQLSILKKKDCRRFFLYSPATYTPKKFYAFDIDCNVPFQNYFILCRYQLFKTSEYRFPEIEDYETEDTVKGFNYIYDNEREREEYFHYLFLFSTNLPSNKNHLPIFFIDPSSFDSELVLATFLIYFLDKHKYFQTIKNFFLPTKQIEQFRIAQKRIMYKQKNNQ
ncbi:hypothetical protein ACO02O_09587 [Dirofilaria immitis]